MPPMKASEWEEPCATHSMKAWREQYHAAMDEADEQRARAEKLEAALRQISEDCNEQLWVVAMAGRYDGFPPLSKGRVRAMFNVIYRRACAALAEAEGEQG